MDRIWLIGAALLAAAGLVMLVVRLARGRRPGSIGILGLVVIVAGALTIVVGLFMASRIAHVAGMSAQGDRGVTATVIIGAGFVVVAAGQLLASIGVLGRGPEQPRPQYAPPFANPHQSSQH